MRDIVSCLSENAINIANPSCSNVSNTSCISQTSVLSIQNTVTSTYKLTLSTQKHVFVSISWSKNNTTQGLFISFNNDNLLSFKLNTTSRLFRKKKGSKLIDNSDTRIEILWDLSLARYESTRPEPVNGFYVLVLVDSEIGLVLGDLVHEVTNKKCKNLDHTEKKYKNLGRLVSVDQSDDTTATSPVAKVRLISQQEHCSCSGDQMFYATKARFCETGAQHEIWIKCSNGDNVEKHPVLSVFIDKKNVIRVKRLQWNFRGNQSIFIDGLLIDVFWDVHDWFFGSGYGVFMFRTRSGMDSRLWLEDNNKKLVVKEQDNLEFSLLVCAGKTP